MTRLLVVTMLPVVLFAVDVDPQQPAPAPLVTLAPFDPLRGIDADGRIPQAKPSDLPDRDRWRYIPEGRIMPGNPIDRFLVSSFIAPIFFYEEAIGAGFGLAVTDIDFRNQRRQEFLGLFVAWTTQGQERYTAVWQRWLDKIEVPGGGVVIADRSWVRAIGGYERTRTRRFFGFGADTTADDETSYTDEVSHARVQTERALPGDWVVNAGLGGEHRNLAKGYVPNVPSTNDIFPVEFATGDGLTSLWGSAGLRYDTRDSAESPYHGWSLGISWDGPLITSDHRHGGIVTARGTLAIPVPGLFHNGAMGDEENPPTDTIAFGAFGSGTHGDLPYWALPSLGGSNTLRGYLGDRFTDRAALHASLEWRLWVIPRGHAFTKTIRIERLGIAPFVDVGSVADTPEHLSNSTIRQSIGLGFRAMFERTAVFRLDIAKSPEQIGFNFNFGMAF